MVFQKRLTHLLVWVTCDSLLRKRMLLYSHTHQPITCKHAFFKYPWVKLWNDTYLQKSPRGGGRVSLSGPWTIYIVGDFNINLLLAETSRYAHDFLLSLQSFSFIPGAGPGGPPPPIFRPSWGLKGRKKVFWRPDPPYLRIWMTAPPPWSEGLDPPLQLLINQHTVCHLNRQWFG